MKAWKSISKRVFYPPVWLMLLLSAASAAGLVLVFVNHWDTSPPAYGVYAAASYSLSVVCVYVITAAPKLYRAAMQKVDANRYGRQYMNDKTFQMRVKLHLSLGMNAFYACIHLFSGIYYRSVWFITLAVYYMLLASIRFLLLRHVIKNELGKNLALELSRCRACGVLLLVMNAALSGVVILVIHQNKGFKYAGVLIYVMAAYAFTMLATSVINVIKYRKYKSPVVSAEKAVHLVAALVSMLSLETAMLAQFDNGQHPPAFRQTVTALTGGFVCLFVVGLSARMVFQSSKGRKALLQSPCPIEGGSAMENKEEPFRYSYSAKQQEEVKRIRNKYIPKEEDKMEQLRRLDQSAARPGSIAALSVGTAGALILGVGMCLCMVWAGSLFVPGIIIGSIGIAGVSLAYPLYLRITKKRRERLAPEIMRLTDELMK